MRKLLLKNLTAHKGRNRLTALIYALSIGFIIFLVVSYNLEIRLISSARLKSEGAVVSYAFYPYNYDQADVDKALGAQSHNIKCFGFATARLTQLGGQSQGKEDRVEEIHFGDLGRVK